MNNKSCRITVFTPAYNRGYIIEKLYRSLQRQTFTDFEWLIVDDGSKDDTEERVHQFQAAENPFLIRYIKTENGGKHRAVNRGVQEARGELFFIVDSDDYIADDALKKIHDVESSIPKEEKHFFAGICGLKGYPDLSVIGTSFDGIFLDICTLDRIANGITGDKAEVFYTDILRRYPFPEFEGEKFLTECVVWDRIAADRLKLRFYNHISIVCNYLQDGLTVNLDKHIQASPRGHALYLLQSQKYGKLKGVEKCNEYIGFYECMKEKMTFAEISELLHTEPIRLRVMLLGMRIYRRLFERRGS